MDGARATPRMRVQIRVVQPGTAGFELALALAARVLAQDRYPLTSGENYALKIAAGYVLHPSHENDSCYFLLRL